jgi:hypothetical protein
VSDAQAVADLYLAGWTVAEAQERFWWLPPLTYYAAWATLTVEEQLAVLGMHYPDARMKDAVQRFLRKAWIPVFGGRNRKS